MGDTTVEDFQSYHNRRPSCDDNASSPAPISSLHDSDSDPFSSPSPHETSHNPLNDPIFDPPSHASSPDTSPQHSGSDDEISVLLSNYQNPSRVSSQQHRPSSPYTPLKMRPTGFRNPSSVRAMQDTSPPHYHLTSPPFSPKSAHSQRFSSTKFPTSSRNGTPRSQHSPSKSKSPSKKSSPAKKEYPLVLLHVTLLPIPTTYSRTVLERVLPPHILENWKILREKVTPTVLERGILIPHPREDYDLLEERLLESLELRMPRILACGHFHLNADEAADLDAAAEDERRVQEGGAGANDADICTDCGRRVRDGLYGAGTGNRRWDIKLYAANGLMRAGAWGAAWKEMERVDVEVCPFVSEELKRELQIAREQEEIEEALRRAGEPLHSVNVPAAEEDPIPNEESGTNGIDDARMREIYGDDAQEYIDGLQSTPSSSPHASPTYPTPNHASGPRPPSAHQLPLSTLLRNYIVLLSRDPRNLAIALLSLLVLLLAIASRSAPATGGVASELYDAAEVPAAASQVYSRISPSHSSSKIVPSPSTPIIATSEPDPQSRLPETHGVTKRENQEADDSPEGQTSSDPDRSEVEGMNDQEESTTGKVMRAVDGVLEMMGGDEMAD